MSAGVHKEYVISIYQTIDKDYSGEIRLGINTQLGTKGHVNKVKDKDEKDND